MSDCSKKEASDYWIQFDFEPLFFILDKECKWVMAVREEDQYEYKGVYFACYGAGKWKIWHAGKNRQQPREYYPSFDFTKDEATALTWAYNNRHLPDTQDVYRERNEDFPVY